MAKKINKKQVDAVFGGKQKLFFESENRIKEVNNTNSILAPDIEQDFTLDVLEDNKNRFILSFRTTSGEQDEFQGIKLVDTDTNTEYPLTVVKLGTNNSAGNYNHIYEITAGLENYSNAKWNKYKVRIKSAKNSSLYNINIVEILKYPQPKTRGGESLYGWKDSNGNVTYQISNNLGELLGNFTTNLNWKTALPIENSQTLTEKCAGRVLVCNNDSDITLELSQLYDNYTFSVVKISAGKVTFTYTGGTFIGDTEITGGQGSSASVIMFNCKAIINTNNK